MARMTPKVRFIYGFCLFILLAGAVGFGYKLYEMSTSVLDAPEYGFSLPPVLTYLSVASGFFCLLVVAVMRGMFRNVEQPKYRMLEMEAEYDAQEARATVPAEDEERDADAWWKGDVHK